ncbi:MAG: hypothetical protein ABIQ36_12815 [Rhodanobacter sp.]
MDIQPLVADQCHLRGEQRQVADKDRRVKVDDQRIVQTEFSHVLETIDHETGQPANPDQDGEQEKRVPIRARWRGKVSEGDCGRGSLPRGKGTAAGQTHPVSGEYHRQLPNAAEGAVGNTGKESPFRRRRQNSVQADPGFPATDQTLASGPDPDFRAPATRR